MMATVDRQHDPDNSQYLTEGARDSLDAYMRARTGELAKMSRLVADEAGHSEVSELDVLQAIEINEEGQRPSSAAPSPDMVPLISEHGLSDEAESRVTETLRLRAHQDPVGLLMLLGLLGLGVAQATLDARYVMAGAAAGVLFGFLVLLTLRMLDRRQVQPRDNEPGYRVNQGTIVVVRPGAQYLDYSHREST